MWNASSGRRTAIKTDFRGTDTVFDPVYKQVIFATDKDGKPAGRYVDIRPGFYIPVNKV